MDEYEWAGWSDLIKMYNDFDKVFKDGWEVEGGAFKRKLPCPKPDHDTL